MLVIQIPIVFFVVVVLLALSAIYAFVRVMAWHYQTKALKMQATFRRPITIDRDDAWQSVKQLHGRIDNDEM